MRTAGLVAGCSGATAIRQDTYSHPNGQWIPSTGLLPKCELLRGATSMGPFLRPRRVFDHSQEFNPSFFRTFLGWLRIDSSSSENRFEGRRT
jgi:hypothetical protein